MLTPIFTINLSLLRALHYYTVSILIVCSFSQLMNTKGRYTVPSFRHILCRLCIHSTLASFFSPIHHNITMSFVHINTLFCYVYSNHYSVAIIEHKVEYHCTIYFKITVVNIVSCIAVLYCCFIVLYLSQVYLLHPNYYTVSILTHI